MANHDPLRQIHPPSPDAGADPSIKVLKLTVATLLLGACIALIALRFVAPEQLIRSAAPLLVIGVALVGWVLIDVGQVRAAKYILAFGACASVTVIAGFTGGVRAPVVISYPVVILMTAWIINSTAALVVAGLTVTATIGLMGAESAGWLPVYLPSSLAIHAGDQIVVYVVSFALSVLLLRAFKGRLQALQQVSADLTERSNDLEIAKAELNQAQSVANIGSWVYDHKTDSLRLSPQCCRIFQLPTGAQMSRDAYVQLVHPDDRESIYAALCGALNREVLDHEHRILVSGSVRWVRQRAELTLAADGSAVGAVGTAQDVTVRKQREEALQESEQRYRTAFQISPDAVNINRIRDGLYLDVNGGFTRLTGWTREEVVGKTSMEINIWHSLADRDRLVQTLRRDGKCEDMEAEFVAKDGRVIVGLMSAHPMLLNGEQCILSVTRDITQRKRDEREINHLAFYDPLTLLPNRRLLMDRLHQALAAASRHQRKGALLFVDLDDFKTLNESLGHDKGDLMLQHVARTLLVCVREGDTVARLGGDEFVVLLEDLSESLQEAATQAETVGGKIITTLNQTYDLASARHHSTSSIGITLFGGGQHENVEEPVKRAELAMYQAKAAGRNTLRFFEPQMQATVTSRAAMEMGLREAVQKNQFMLHYQAQVTDKLGITGVECLVRWKNPLRGMVAPGEFIQLAEETGLIIPLGSWVLETACAQLARWATQVNTAHWTVAVNVSARQFLQSDFVAQVLATLLRTGAPASQLKLELTESLLVSNVEDVIAKMNALKGMGVGFSLDDFGTGYSSLSYLKRMPLDQVKIDQGFVRDILIDPNDASIAKMVVALANSLGLAVIAEGVETEAQRDFLASLGCLSYQGYLFNRPMPLAEFENYALQFSASHLA